MLDPLYKLEALVADTLIFVDTFGSIQEAQSRAEAMILEFQESAVKLLRGVNPNLEEEQYQDLRDPWEMIVGDPANVIFYTPKKINRGASMFIVRPLSGYELLIKHPEILEEEI